MTRPAPLNIRETRKASRVRLAKSEVVLQAAIAVQSWGNNAKDCGVNGNGAVPFEKWPDDDPLKDIAMRYGLSKFDMHKICTTVAQSLEDRALRTGYEDAWLDGVGEA